LAAFTFFNQVHINRSLPQFSIDLHDLRTDEPKLIGGGALKSQPDGPRDLTQ
jgi:hypothetical protein